MGHHVITGIFELLQKDIVITSNHSIFSYTPSTLLIHSFHPHFFSSPPTSLLHRREEKHRVYKNRIKAGVKEKKKTQGMRRDLGHHCGVLNTPSSSCQPNYSTRSFGCFFYAIMGENWMTKMLENWEITDSVFLSFLLFLLLSYSTPSIYFSKKAEKAVGTPPEKPFPVEKESRCGHTGTEGKE